MNGIEEHLSRFAAEAHTTASVHEHEADGYESEGAPVYHDREDALAHVDPEALYDTGIISGGERSWVLDGAGVQLPEDGPSEIQITDARTRPEVPSELTSEQEQAIDELVEKRNIPYGEARRAVLGRQ